MNARTCRTQKTYVDDSWLGTFVEMMRRAGPCGKCWQTFLDAHLEHDQCRYLESVARLSFHAESTRYAVCVIKGTSRYYSVHKEAVNTQAIVNTHNTVSVRYSCHDHSNVQSPKPTRNVQP